MISLSDLDALGKPPSGLLAGNVMAWPGSYSECTKMIVGAHYCLASINVPIKLNIGIAAEKEVRSNMNRVWKGTLGIRDLTKIRCGIQENAKYLDRIRDLTATREAVFAKIWARDAGFCCLSVGNSGIFTTQIKVIAAKANQPGERKISIERANLHLKFISFCRN